MHASNSNRQNLTGRASKLLLFLTAASNLIWSVRQWLEEGEFFFVPSGKRKPWFDRLLLYFRRMKTTALCASLLLLSCVAAAQSYTSYFTGDTANATTSPTGGICVMGGATEHDEAMKWFLERADGGDVLVIRASGSDGYNDYLFTDLGITVNSVETIVFDAATAADDAYVIQQVANAEAIWIAGGDQWDYVSYWRDSPIDSTINEGLNNRNLALGGTSAGMAVLGGVQFTAENGTVTSATALNNPFDSDVAISNASFFDLPILSNVITDTHYDDPDRSGRHVVFMARMVNDYGVDARGIACDEYTSVCIHPDGRAYVYGEAPAEEDYAYFLQVRCVDPKAPETITSGTPLTWDLGNEALYAYRINGDNNGTHWFDLTDWETASGGEWQHWWVDNGSLMKTAGGPPDCEPVAVGSLSDSQDLTIWPNPARNFAQFSNVHTGQVTLMAPSGAIAATRSVGADGRFSTTGLAQGLYIAQPTAAPEHFLRLVIAH